jgi:hypothetical protein
MTVLRSAFSDLVDPVAIGSEMVRFWKKTLQEFLIRWLRGVSAMRIFIVHCPTSGIFGARRKGSEAGAPPAVNGN